MQTSVLEYLEKSADKTPNKSVFLSESSEITFLQLEKSAKSIGTYLTDFVERGNAVAVFMEKGIYSPACYLGIVYSGCFYVPLDDQLPENRIETILSVINAKIILTDRKNYSKLKSLKKDLNILLVDEAMECPVDEARLRAIKENRTDLDPLYVLFTSGSTGVPKGVVTPHRALINYIDEIAQTFSFSETDVFGNQSSFDFVGAIRDIYIPLKTGCTSFIIPKEYFMSPKMLLECLNKNKINVLCWAASAMSIIASLKAFDSSVPEYIEKVLFSGSVLPCRHLSYWQKYLPKVSFTNHYGPTEITASCSYHTVDHMVTDEEVLAIGKPFRNTQIFLLAEDGKEAQTGEIGELCVKGSCLALGYYNNIKKTQEVFVQNPLNDKYPETVYKTGDLGSKDKFGVFWFHGRKDNQIKHMGYRIELDEIEAVANAMKIIDIACCLYDEKSEKIVLFYQAEIPCNKEIMLHIKSVLPKYMLPNKMIHYLELPVNNSNKIDRIKLKESL